MELCKNILNLYNNKEKTTNIRYYSNCEFDSVVTEFESLSNANCLLFSSSLDLNSVELLMKIFQAVYDNNYIFFIQNLDYNFYIDDDSEYFSYNDFEAMNLFNPSNYLNFIQSYLLYNNNLKEKKGVDQYNEDGRIGNIAIYNEIPEINDLFISKSQINENSFPKQQIFIIQDIINLMNK